VVEEVENSYLVHDVEEMAHIVDDRMNKFYQAQGAYEQYQNNMAQMEDGNHDMESDSVVDGDESEKNMQQLNQSPDIDGELSKEVVGMEVDNNGFSSENGKADEKN
jgi:intron-binding protein aquarius